MAIDCLALARPLGMARALVVLLSIVSFACTINFHGSSTITATCASGGEAINIPVRWEYPFWLSSIKIDNALCNHSSLTPTQSPSTSQTTFPLFYVEFGVQAQFFVFVGVCSFLVSLVWVIVYVGFWRAYVIDTVLPTTDLIVSIVVSLMWLCADCAWASAYGSMQSYLAHDQILQSIRGFDFCQDGGLCVIEQENAEFGNGGFGLTLGFVNCIMWILNAFLAYREQQKIKFERDRLVYTQDAFRAQSTPSETMDASSINSRVGFRAI